MKLARNGDEVNGLQKKVLEMLDKRIEEIEVFKGDERTKTLDSVQRMFSLEIKLEKLLPRVQDAHDLQAAQRRELAKTTEEVKQLQHRLQQNESAITSHE